MSDGAFTIATPHPDVADLAQGFIERVDGEHLLLPLPQPLNAGAALQFMVVLADGTAAFMGAGVCADVSDQGDAAPAEHRYETLLAQLQFDERSQPVYDYIVAIRAQAIAIQEQQGGGNMAGDDEPTEYVDTQAAMASLQSDTADVEMQVDDWQSTEADVDTGASELAIHQPAIAAEPPANQFRTAPPVAVPTGVLQRPAIGVHWQSASPRRPTPSPSSGLFRYNGAGLPAPSAPPFPELAQTQWVQPAPKPSDAVEAVASAPVVEEAAEPEAAEYDAEADFDAATATESEAPVDAHEENPWDA